MTTTTTRGMRRARRPLALLASGALAAGLLGVATTAPANAAVRSLDASCAGLTSTFFPDLEALPDATRDAVACLEAYGLTAGRTDGTFGPNETVTRQNMAIFVTRQIGYVLENSGLPGGPDVEEAPFTDRDELTPEGRAAVDLLWTLGVTEGFADNTFRPEASISRAEMSRFVDRVQDVIAELADDPTVAYDPDDADAVFSDVPAGSPAGPAIYSLQGAGIVQGTGAGRFSPAAPVLRSQMAFFLMRHLDENIAAERVQPLVAYTLTIAHNNDGESGLVPSEIEGDLYGGVALFAGTVDETRDEATTTPTTGERGFLLLNSGDNYLAGTAFAASRVEGAPFYDALAVEALGYDALAIGNHEFDFGPDVLAEFIGEVDGTPFVSANLDVSDEPALQAFRDSGKLVDSVLIEDVGGAQVGVIGLTTPLLPLVSSPRGVVVDPDLAGITQAEADALRADGADVVVLQSHLQDIRQEQMLVEAISGVDVVIGGGGGELLADDDDVLVPGDTAGDTYPLFGEDADGAVVPIVTTAGNYQYLGRIVLHFDADGFLVGYDDDNTGVIRVSDADGTVADPELVSTVQEPVEAFQSELAQTEVATLPFALQCERNDVRGAESNCGNLIADAHLATAAAQAATFGVAAPDVAVMNGGGIRGEEDRPAGVLTLLDTFELAPFGNFVSVAEEVSREDFRQLLEEGVNGFAADGTGTDGGFVSAAGFSYTVDTTQQARVTTTEGEQTTAGARIRSVVLDDDTVIVQNGVVVDGDALSVAGLNFSLGGGDAYPPQEFTTLGVTDQESLANYLTAQPGGTVSDDYDGPKGRITITP